MLVVIEDVQNRGLLKPILRHCSNLIWFQPWTSFDEDWYERIYDIDNDEANDHPFMIKRIDDKSLINHVTFLLIPFLCISEHIRDT